MKLALEKLAREMSFQRGQTTMWYDRKEARHACLKHPKPIVTQRSVMIQTISKGNVRYTYYEFAR